MQFVLTTTTPMVGWQFGEYMIDGLLGEGGVATVYSARKSDGITVALKVLKEKAAEHSKVRDSFRKEFTIAARLAHSGLIRTFEQGELHGHHYLSMQHVSGKPLSSLLSPGKRLSLAQAVHIAQFVAQALDYLHQQGIVHRDVKPSNIMLDETGTPHLCDFGLAINVEQQTSELATETNDKADDSLYGTPLYIAPEQAQSGSAVDGRADLYALGVVLYRMITGRTPFYGTMSDLLNAHKEQAPPAPTDFVRLSPALNNLLLKALAKDPSERFQSGAEFAAALANVELTVPPRFIFPWPQRLRRRIG